MPANLKHGQAENEKQIMSLSKDTTDVPYLNCVVAVMEDDGRLHIERRLESDLNSLAFSHCHRVVALEVIGVMVTLVVARRAELSVTSCQTDVTGWRWFCCCP